jgi:hypothetical protein
MKKMFYTLIGILSITCASAVQPGSDLKIRMFDNRAIIVSIDDLNFNNPSPVVFAEGLNPGAHRITVWSIRNNHYGYNHQPRMVYSGILDIPYNSIVKTVITRNNILKVISIEPKFVAPVVYQPFNPYQPCHYNPQPAVVPVSNTCSQFQALKATIASKSFDNTRYQIAAEYIRNNGISTREVGELMNLLTFESNKLDLAKFAYRYTADPQNYFMLYNEFTFDSSIRNLSDYIGRS